MILCQAEGKLWKIGIFTCKIGGRSHENCFLHIEEMSINTGKMKVLLILRKAKNAGKPEICA